MIKEKGGEETSEAFTMSCPPSQKTHVGLIDSHYISVMNTFPVDPALPGRSAAVAQQWVLALSFFNKLRYSYAWVAQLHFGGQTCGFSIKREKSFAAFSRNPTFP